MILHGRSTRRILILLLAGVGIAGSERSAAQVPRVYRDRVEPHWFGDNTKFWYRVALPEKESEFVLVDTFTGTRNIAFDHQRVAEKLSEATSSAVDAARLPIRSLQFSDDLATVALNCRTGTWKLDLKSYDVVRTDTGDAATVANLTQPP